MDKEILKKYWAELVETFVLVFIDCGSVAIAGEYAGFTGISFRLSVLAIGLTDVMLQVVPLFHGSGCSGLHL